MKVNPILITEGKWGETPWQFFADHNPPDTSLCTATFCIVTFQEKIVLVKHTSRGYEFPGGHIDYNEHPTETVRREIREEAGIIIKQPIYFGYKKVSPAEPIPHRDNPSKIYPFPHSYTLYYFAEAEEIMRNIELTSDVIATKIVNLNEAKELLAIEQNHHVIMEYLLNNQLIKLK
jgi:8-oxo-dGTP pyrophosphatase MutT (NUDIX family)